MDNKKYIALINDLDMEIWCAISVIEMCCEVVSSIDAPQPRQVGYLSNTLQLLAEHLTKVVEGGENNV